MMPRIKGYTGPYDGHRWNGQTVEKKVKSADYCGKLSVHSIFHTIQGEGPFCGTPCVFVRLAGCNLVCPFCDTEYTAGRQDMTPENILVKVMEYRPQGGLVVITGGEPFRQPLGVGDLVQLLNAWGYYVQIESNGTLPPAPGIEWNQNIMERRGAYIVCSPKSGLVNNKIWEVACCAKYVGSAEDIMEDGLPRQALGHPVKTHLARPPEDFDRPIYLQPADHQDKDINHRNLQAVIKSVMEHGYIIQIQIHKILDME